MRIESINIQHFRQYNDALIKFPKLSENACDVHIILGNNGVGKTNMLNAITWCLYGIESHLGDKATSIDMINTQYVEELKNNGQNEGDVLVEITLSSDSKTVVFGRYAKYSLKGNARTMIDAYHEAKYMENDEWVIVDRNNEEAWLGLVQCYIPQEINEYIFFDGEQLQNYFHDGSKIKQGIKDLTQASLLLNLVDKFNKYYEQELNPKVRSCNDDTIKQKQANVDTWTEKCRVSQGYIDEFNNQIVECKENIERLKIIISGHDSLKDKTQQLLKLEEDLDYYEKRKESLLSDLKKYIIRTYPYFALYPSIKSLNDYIQQHQGSLPPKIDRSMLLSILQNKKCCICNRDLDEGAHLHIEEILKKLTLSSDTAAMLNKASTAIVGFLDEIKNFPTVKTKYLDDIKDVEDRISSIEKECESLRSIIKNVSNSEQINKAIDDKDTYTKAYEQYEQKLGVELKNLNTCKSELEAARKELEDALNRNKSMVELTKKIEFCNSCSSILKSTADEILEECRCEMQSKTYNLFSELIWKKDTFKSVTIDENYNFILLDVYENQILGSCSAAERALLALSFTLALQDVSKHDSLLYIDTPVGRVDVENRANFMKTLLNVSKNKQVILTFTPSEYDETIKGVLNGQYNSFTKLEINDGITTIRI